MRTTISPTIISLGLALAMWPQAGQTQSDRDYVFDDLEGHLVIRFAGTGTSALHPSQAEEVINAELSSMVHDRLRADLLFEDEPHDPEWAAAMAPQIEEHARHAGPEFSAIFTECRAASCRLVMEHSMHWTVPEHRVVLETVQKSLDAFIADRPQEFEPVFMITAYYQEFEIPHIKAFLRRAAQVPPRRPH
jgi:hypothetical protein